MAMNYIDHLQKDESCNIIQNVNYIAVLKLILVCWRKKNWDVNEEFFIAK